jgi:uncharacterized membrane protein YobD (UPF0266 family)
MYTPKTNLPVIRQRTRKIDAWVYGSVVVAILSGAIFHDDAAIVAGLIAAASMMVVWMFKTGVRKFFCGLFLIVPVLFCATEAVLLWRKF